MKRPPPLLPVWCAYWAQPYFWQASDLNRLSCLSGAGGDPGRRQRHGGHVPQPARCAEALGREDPARRPGAGRRQLPFRRHAPVMAVFAHCCPVEATALALGRVALRMSIRHRWGAWGAAAAAAERLQPSLGVIGMLICMVSAVPWEHVQKVLCHGCPYTAGVPRAADSAPGGEPGTGRRPHAALEARPPTDERADGGGDTAQGAVRRARSNLPPEAGQMEPFLTLLHEPSRHVPCQRVPFSKQVKVIKLRRAS